MLSEWEPLVALNLFTAFSFFISPQVPLGPAIALSALYANSMMVLVNDRISARHDDDLSSTALVQLQNMTDVASRQPVPENLAEGGDEERGGGTKEGRRTTPNPNP